MTFPRTPSAAPPEAYAVRLAFGLASLLLAALLIVSHGCHGDDVDHEPHGAAPVRDTAVTPAAE